MRQITSRYIQECRAANYVHHFDCRKYMKAIADTAPYVLQHYQRIAELIKRPILNPFGCDSYNDEQWRYIIKVANAENLDASFLISWYLSDEGWQDFQKQWFELPEPSQALCCELTAVQGRVAGGLVMESE